jgi:sulfonate transport system ATP-binding protein
MFTLSAMSQREEGREYVSPQHATYLTAPVTEKTFLGRQQRLVLRNLSFDVAHGEFLSLLGPSGCGKTTLLRLIAGLDTTYTGRIVLDGKTIDGPGVDRGMVFQESRLLPWMTVAENVAFALSPRASDDGATRVRAALALVGLSGAADALPYELSGGMEKRTALARALVNVPKLLLLDEPLTGLDSFAKFAMQDEIARIHALEHVTTLLVTHDIDEAIYLTDRIAILSAPPTSIQRVFTVSLPRPRVRDSAEYQELRTQVLREVLRQAHA